MAIDDTLAKKIQNLETVYVLIAASTRLPFVECDPETFDDQVHLYAEEEGLKKALQEYAQQQIPLVTAKIEQPQRRIFLTSLHLIGVNMLVFHEGFDVSRIPLDEIAAMDPKFAEKKDLPLVNAALQLTTIYFLQELRRPNQNRADQERTRHLQELEEEMMANLSRSNFILMLDASKVQKEPDPNSPGSGIQIPCVKAPNGDMFQPIFSDVWEFQKFQQNPNSKMQMAAVPFRSLANMLTNPAKGFVLNPSGINLILTREYLAAIAQRFAE